MAKHWHAKADIMMAKIIHMNALLPSIWDEE